MLFNYANFIFEIKIRNRNLSLARFINSYSLYFEHFFECTFKSYWPCVNSKPSLPNQIIFYWIWLNSEYHHFLTSWKKSISPFKCTSWERSICWTLLNIIIFKTSNATDGAIPIMRSRLLLSILAAGTYSRNILYNPRTYIMLRVWITTDDGIGLWVWTVKQSNWTFAAIITCNKRETNIYPVWRIGSGKNASIWNE